MARRFAWAVTGLLALPFAGAQARGDDTFAPGSSNTSNIEPAVSHPAETPCVVPLFSGATFGGNPVPFRYAPPRSCGTSWARVVLRTTIGLNAGRQYDRTGSITLDGVSLWFGTTAEPRTGLAPNWTVETDVTRDTALLRKSGAGRVLIGNYTNDIDTSIITSSAELLFYPANARNPAPLVPDLVIPLASNSDGDSAGLSNSAATLSATLNLPRNVVEASLDVTLQGQSGDEFWYTCVPDPLMKALNSCGGGAFRVGEVTIDGRPAGEAPVFPLIFTGGIDPYLWEPVPGVTTLNIRPFPVELTPFAGMLSDGAPHLLSLTVDGANNYFSVFGALYVTLDKGAGLVTGAVTQDSLTGAPTVSVSTASGKVSSGATTHLATLASHDFTIGGYADTSIGRVETTVHQTFAFSNVQDFLIGGPTYDQAIVQGTKTHTVVTRATRLGVFKSVDDQSYPLKAAFDEVIAPDGSATQTTTIEQTLRASGLDTLDGFPVALRDLLWTASPVDTVAFSAAGSITGHSGEKGQSIYADIETSGGCNLVTLATIANVLTSAERSASCAAVIKALFP